LNKKKLIAQIVISTVIVLYYIWFAYACIFVEDIPLLVKIFGGVIPLILSGICIYVIVELIKEIRSGEEYDLSKY
jgi:hypothetical protein